MIWTFRHAHTVLSGCTISAILLYCRFTSSGEAVRSNRRTLRRDELGFTKELFSFSELHLNSVSTPAPYTHKVLQHTFKCVLGNSIITFHSVCNSLGYILPVPSAIHFSAANHSCYFSLCSRLFHHPKNVTYIRQCRLTKLFTGLGSHTAHTCAEQANPTSTRQADYTSGLQIPTTKHHEQWNNLSFAISATMYPSILTYLT